MNLSNTCRRTIESEKETLRIIYPMTHITQIILTLICNLTLCWLVYKTKRLRTPNNMILVSLCICDILQVYVFLSKTVAVFAENKDTICTNVIMVARGTVVITQVHLIALSMDRLLAIKYPLRYMKWVTVKRAVIVAILIWVILTVLQLACYLALKLDNDEERKFWKGMSHCSHNRSLAKTPKAKVNTVIVYSCLYFVPLFIIVISYTISFRVALGQVKKMFPLTEHDMRKKAALKAAKTTAILIGTYFILYTPCYVAVLVHKLRDRTPGVCPSNFGYYFRIITSNISLAAAWINPLVYTLTNADFKEALFKLFKRRGAKTTSLSHSADFVKDAKSS